MKPLKININQIVEITENFGNLKILISPITVNSSNFILGISRLSPGKTVKKHIHDYSDEGFYVLRGKGIIYFDEFEYIPFSQGDAVHVPKGICHSIENTGDEEMEVIFTASPLAPNTTIGHRVITE